jgi:enoyl-CoA hydratase
MTNDAVLYERRGPSAWLTLNRPDKLNALSDAIVAGLHAGMERAEADDEVKLLVLTGSGRAFSAGFDIGQDFGVDTAEGWWGVLEKDVAVTMRLRTFPKPTIAAVRGWCLGGACDLAMACDMIVAAEDARFGEPEIRFGSCPVTMLMPFVIGEKKTNELLYTGEAIDAAEAERIGLVNRVVPAAELAAQTVALARRIADGPPRALAMAKSLLTRGLGMDLETSLSWEALVQGMMIESEDHREGLAAFFEKRPPRFTGS